MSRGLKPIPDFVRDISPNQDIKSKRNQDWLWICPVHGEYKQRYCSHVDVKNSKIRHGCPICRYKDSGYNFKSQWNKEHSEVVLEDVSPNQDLSTSRGGYWLWICPVHGEYKQLYSNHVEASTGKRKFGCEKCARSNFFKNICKNGKRSFIELEIEEYVKSLGLTTRHASRYLDGTFEVDILIEELNLGIESDGFGHEEVPIEIYGKYKSEGKWWYKPEGYHKHKDELAAKQGITLIHIKDSDWQNDQESVKQYILEEINKRR